MSRPTPEQLYALQAQLNDAQIYYLEEVEGFCSVFFQPKAAQTPGDHAKLNAWLDKAVKRFGERSAGEHGQEECEEFRGRLVAFRNLYAFLSQVIPYGDSDLEKLYTLRALPDPQAAAARERAAVHLRRRGLAEVLPAAEDQRGADRPAPRARAAWWTAPPRSAPAVVADEKVELSKLIEIINERFGTSFTEADELFFSQIREEAVADEQLQQAAVANEMEAFKLVFDKALEGLFIGRMEQNEAITAKFLDDKAFRGSVSRYLLKQVYEQIRGEALAV